MYATKLDRHPLKVVFSLLVTFLFAANVLPVFGEGQKSVKNEAVPIVKTVEILRGDGEFRVAADEPVESSTHPPLDEIPPIPFPTDRANLPKPGKNRLAPVGVGYNAETGEVTLLNKQKAKRQEAQTQVGGYRGVDGGEAKEQDFSEQRMSGGMTVVDPSIYPNRVNVKLAMRFQDAGGTDRYFVASGTMIDAETVLTAGHCIYDQTYGWAKEVWVYPGWSGQGLYTDTANHYGLGKATNFYSNTGWTTNGDFNYDLGVIVVSRAAGMLTGWHGWSYGGDCSWHTSTTYHNGSFPAEGCHNGATMYYWLGNFDGCSGNRLRLDTSPGCTTAVWGGMSGSGAYYNSNGSYYISAVCSTSDRSSVAYYAQVWEQMAGWISNDYIPSARGSTFDLQALQMRGTQSTVTAGNSLNTLSHYMTNPTNGSANKTFSFGVYLSTNNIISTADTLLSQQIIGTNLVAMQSLRLTLAPVTIPQNTPSGSYYIGVIYDSSTDGNTANNSTNAWDAFPIQVQAAPPSAPQITSALTAGATVGTQFAYSITATNSPTSYNATNLPPGLGVNTGSGIISGTPTTAGTWNVTISATNAGGTGSAILKITTSSQPPRPPVITSPLVSTGTIGVQYSYNIAATNSPTSFNATNLPPGLSVNTSTGRISGTPNLTGLWHVTIAATNADGSDSKVLELTISNSSCNCALDCILDTSVESGKKAVESLLPYLDLPMPLDAFLGSVRNFRDSTLKATPEGRQLVDAYYAHSDEVWRLAMRQPEMVPEIVRLLAILQPMLKTANSTGTVVLTADQWDRGFRLIEALQADASSDLREALNDLQDFLNERQTRRGNQVIVRLKPADQTVAATPVRSWTSSAMMLVGTLVVLSVIGMWLMRRHHVSVLAVTRAS